MHCDVTAVRALEKAKAAGQYVDADDVEPLDGATATSFQHPPPTLHEEEISDHSDTDAADHNPNKRLKTSHVPAAAANS